MYKKTLNASGGAIPSALKVVCFSDCYHVAPRNVRKYSYFYSI